MKQLDTLIIGAGSAGLTAARQVQQRTDSWLLVQDGPYGTTCARTGCMPSKVLIQTAKDFHRRELFTQCGINGADKLSVDRQAVMQHVRNLRDKFTRGMIQSTDTLAGEHLLKGRARILAPDRVSVNGQIYGVKKLIIAAGSQPLIPREWNIPPVKLLTSQSIFEQEELPERIAVVGLGVIGLELGQALARLGHQITGFDMLPTIKAVSDPQVAEAAVKQLRTEFPLHFGHRVKLQNTSGGVLVKAGATELEVDAVLASLGTVPNIRDLGMENLGVKLDRNGVPEFNRMTMQIEDLPVFIAGDCNGCRPILHEALDEGFIAGRNSGTDKPESYCRRTPLRIIFSDPQLAVAGSPFNMLDHSQIITGSADFSGQSRAMVEQRAYGLLHIYADRVDGRLLGAEMAIPEAEHIAHQLAWAVQQQLTVRQMLAQPFYHPTVEEGLRSALRDAAAKLPPTAQPGELSLCGCCPEKPLC